VSSLTLVDADTFQPISQYNPIANGATINRATLPTQNLTIQANTSPATVGSVAFDLVNSGYLNTVNTAPYDLCGTAPCSNLGVGLHSLTTTPYMGSNASGGAGTSMSISFSVIDPTPTPDPTPSPTPSPTPTPVGCTHIPGTSTAVGAACFSRSSCPALSNPQNPVSYGADNTGGKDSTTAFQNAVNAGDLYISTAGTYLINGNNSVTGVIPPAGRKVECAAGVTLKTTLHGGSLDTGIIAIENNNTIVCGCDFQGGNTGSGAKVLDSNQYNWLIYDLDGNTGALIEDNTFENSFGNAAVQVNGASNATIQFNTFSGNAYYGPTINKGDSEIIQNNLSIDSPIGMEAGSCSGTSNTVTNSLIQNNMVEVVHGDCAVASPSNSGCDNNVFITGGDYPSGCNYGSNSVKTNYCTGKVGVMPASIHNVAPSGGVAASYSGNVLGTDCSCQSGGSC
jgi:hypothetical protein